jgi:hypothetical protein
MELTGTYAGKWKYRIEADVILSDTGSLFNICIVNFA